VVGSGYLRIIGVATELTELARRSSITRAGLTGLAKIATRTGKQIRLARLPVLAQIAARIDGQIRLARLATWSIKNEVLVILLTWKSGLLRIWPTRKARLRKIRLTWKTWLYRTWGARNWKKEKVLLQAKGQLHGGAQGVLPRHKNADCERCIKESWL
jgi:hypothetical protein